MIRENPDFGARVEAAVRAIEARTDAEVVVVAAGKSGSYRDLVAAGASLVCFLAFGAAILAPFEFHPAWLWAELGGLWAVAAWVLSAPAILRRIAPAARQQAQVSDAAAAEFHREAVHATPARVGLLVLVSDLERRVELVPDLGLESKIPRGEWGPAREAFARHDLPGFLAGLEAVGELLAKHVPATEGGAGLELSDAPRIRG